MKKLKKGVWDLYGKYISCQILSSDIKSFYDFFRFFLILSRKDGKTLKTLKKMILTNKQWCAKHPFVDPNTQQTG